jgi:hypothetical protein
MAINAFKRQAIRQGQGQESKALMLGAPIGGIDVSRGLAYGNKENCLYSFNMVAAEYGLRVRHGYREWAVGLDNGAGLGVHTIIPYGGDDDDQFNDRLFAVTNEGIWNCTEHDVPPIFVLNFLDAGNGGDITEEAGYGVYTHYITSGGSKLLFYADSQNGLFRYTESTGVWERATAITGPDITKINFVMTHKRQLWMVEQNSSSAWYLDELAVAGEAFEFFFGGKFLHGGAIAGLFSWTIDGGVGVDDYFIAVSRAGDVLPYQGDDPSTVDGWKVVGQWFIGEIPRGPKFGTHDGGNLHLLSVQGLTSLNEMIQGVDGKNADADIESKKIAYMIRPYLKQHKRDRGWEVRKMPGIGNLVINQPKREDGQYVQYVKNTTIDSWGLWRDVPIDCMDEWRGNVHFGDALGRILVMDNFVDNELLNIPAVGINGQAIPFSVLTTFTDFGEATVFKRGKFIRPQFLATSEPSQTCEFRYDYALNESFNTTPSPRITGSVWDMGVWDFDEWDNTIPQGYASLRGGWGIGRVIAISMVGRSVADTTLVSWDVLWDTGWPL